MAELNIRVTRPQTAMRTRNVPSASWFQARAGAEYTIDEECFQPDRMEVIGGAVPEPEEVPVVPPEDEPVVEDEPVEDVVDVEDEDPVEPSPEPVSEELAPLSGEDLADLSIGELRALAADCGIEDVDSYTGVAGKAALKTELLGGE